jgi:hypothetical protein
MFQTFSLDIFFFSSRRKKNAKKGGSFPWSSYVAFSLLPPAFTFSLMPFCFKCFLVAPSSSQA